MPTHTRHATRAARAARAARPPAAGRRTFERAFKRKLRVWAYLGTDLARLQVTQGTFPGRRKRAMSRLRALARLQLTPSKRKIYVCRARFTDHFR